jgi:hypothetical protein
VRVASRRIRSIARLRAVVVIQPPGLAGTPVRGQCAAAIANASATAETKTSVLPSRWSGSRFVVDSCALALTIGQSPAWKDHSVASREDLGARLKRLRLERGLSHRDLSSPGISYAYISRDRSWRANAISEGATTNRGQARRHCRASGNRPTDLNRTRRRGRWDRVRIPHDARTPPDPSGSRRGRPRSRPQSSRTSHQRPPRGRAQRASQAAQRARVDDQMRRET